VQRGHTAFLFASASAAAFATLGLACSALLPETGPLRGALADAPVDAGIDVTSEVLLDAGNDAAIQGPGDGAFDVAPSEGGSAIDASGSMDSAGAPDAGARAWTVLVGENGAHVFTPPLLTIAVGDTVHWVWQTSGHTVASGTGGTADGRFCSPSDTQCQASPTSNVGDTFDHRFLLAGDFPYFCTQHQMMTGVIAVR
jgi:plastocyanin